MSKKYKDEESSDSQEGTQLLKDHNKAKKKLEKSMYQNQYFKMINKLNNALQKETHAILIHAAEKICLLNQMR